MYTFQRPGVAREALATRSLMASTPLLDAASSSWTSKEAPLVISTQESHTPHGSPSTGLSQFSAFARLLAVDVFPVPRGPEERYACATRSSRTAWRRALTTWSW